MQPKQITVVPRVSCETYRWLRTVSPFISLYCAHHFTLLSKDVPLSCSSTDQHPFQPVHTKKRECQTSENGMTRKQSQNRKNRKDEKKKNQQINSAWKSAQKFDIYLREIYHTYPIASPEGNNLNYIYTHTQ